MGLARSIREGVEKNMQKLRIKKKNGSGRTREISADFRGISAREGGNFSSGGDVLSSSDIGVVLSCSARRRNCSSSRGKAHLKTRSSSSHFVDAAPRAKRLVSPQGRKKTMGWMRKITGPLRRAWDLVSCRHIQQSHKRSRGMGRLYNDVRSCGYDDVHLMWSMLQTSNVETSKWRRLSRRQSRPQR